MAVLKKRSILLLAINGDWKIIYSRGMVVLCTKLKGYKLVS